jgi:hypothetical protein
MKDAIFSTPLSLSVPVSGHALMDEGLETVQVFRS